jgi:hypothetical protein
MVERIGSDLGVKFCNDEQIARIARDRQGIRGYGVTRP